MFVVIVDRIRGLGHWPHECHDNTELANGNVTGGFFSTTKTGCKKEENQRTFAKHMFFFPVSMTNLLFHRQKNNHGNL